MHELIANLHMHTTYSDGSGTHRDIADAAVQTGVDVVFVTDHNILVQGVEGYYAASEGDRRTRGPLPVAPVIGQRVLVLVGEEVHNPARLPQKSHMIVLAAGREMAPYGPKIQTLIDHVQRAGGLTFLAHPYDPELKAFGETDISWEDWDVRGYTGIELWNGFSELKSVARGKLDTYFYAFFPRHIARGPHPKTLKKWDELTTQGSRVVAIGGSDAHALQMRSGPLRKTIFPYTFHFQSINTHLILDKPLAGNLEDDRAAVLDALRRGHCFVGYDLPAPTRGFRFTAQGRDATALMGDEIRVNSGVTLQMRLPEKAECRLLCNGKALKTWTDKQICAQIVSKPGVYRVECFINYLGRSRGWIYSNPIYVR